MGSTHRSLGGAEPASLYSKSALLSPVDFLNASASDPAPFDFCPVFGPSDEVAQRRGQWGLMKSRLHMGSGARVQRVVQKAMAGLPVTISVLGGSGESNSECTVTDSQYLRVMELATTQYRPSATPLDCLIGGTRSSHILNRKSRMVQLDGRTRRTLPTAPHITCQIRRI